MGRVESGRVREVGDISGSGWVTISVGHGLMALFFLINRTEILSGIIVGNVSYNWSYCWSPWPCHRVTRTDLLASF